MIIMQATKTDDAFRLSIRPEAKEILLKYDYQPPLMSDQKYKKAFKDFLKELDFDRKLKAKILLQYTKSISPV
tara:strand:- start:284 stop:502 length:219 start_codon:yes stop_codon:yes gene_type:complete